MPALSDEEWAEIQQELPRPADAVLQRYLHGRAGLMAQERKRRADHAFRQALSPVARRACAITDRIRDDERARIWTPELEEGIAVRERHVTVFPGMMFSLAKDTMETTDLWRIARRMPKGALLHAHNDAMVDFDFLIGVLLDTPGIHLACRGSHFGSADNLASELPVFRFLNPHSSAARIAADPGSIWGAASSYEPGAFVLAAQAADAFPHGGRPAFVAWLKSRVIISRTDCVEQHHGQDHVWARFRRCFEVVGSMLHYEPVYRAFLRRLMAQLLADGVRWVELRFTWPLDYCREGHEEPEDDYTHMFSVLDTEVRAFRDRHPDFWGLRMIWTSLRVADERRMVSDMILCVETKQAYPHLIAGYDVVGQEDMGLPLADLLPRLVWFRKLCAQSGVNIPFFFHAGETLGDGTTADDNLYDAVLLGSRRIGHGFSLYKHPLLIELVRDKRILIESCPISNEVLRLCGSVLSHPLPALLARGVPCALSNDDPAMLGHDTAGATHDFWQALQGWHNLGLAGLGSLAENSVRWAAFEDEDDAAWSRGVREASLGGGVKAQRLNEWAVAWEEFCLWIVTEFGDRYDEDDEPEPEPQEGLGSSR